jgi:hypothetical protein
VRRRGLLAVTAGILLVMIMVLSPAQVLAGQPYCSSSGADFTDTCYGTGALTSENGGGGNTAFGYQALSSNTVGNDNAATGDHALSLNTTGSDNTAFGSDALNSNSAGSDNTAVGYGAGVSLIPNTTGSNNTFLGYQAGLATSTQLQYATVIGANAHVGESNALVLGGTGSYAVNVGIGTTTPASLLQVGGISRSYGRYLQVPVVANLNPPPASDCNTTTFVGRLVLQSTGSSVTLWACSGNGTWTAA